MNYQEIASTLKFYKNESEIVIPNEIFEDLKDNMKKGSHIPVAYSYYYVVNWLYRHCKYGNIDIDINKIKEILGYNKGTRTVNYIFDKDGLLDTMGYTETSKDFPLSWELDDLNNLEFNMLSEANKEDQAEHTKNMSRKYSIKRPIKAFNRYDDEVEDGTFHERDNTHLIPFEVFMYCMSNEKIGCTGFYLYSYIKMKNQHFQGKYTCPMDGLAEHIGIPSSTMKPFLSALRKHNLIEGIHNMDYFCFGADKNSRKANSYIANEIDLFSDEEVEFEKLRFISLKEHREIQEAKQKELDGERIHIDLEDLPF
ncbi:hypothetical protein ABEI56_04645 [Peribacillus castrilensis]|uniref:hypothetical protein n=1 Tax=Peribacillus castrilensis TaxID=2897690 RepID=UPI003D2E6255